MDIKFKKLTEPTAEIAKCFGKWENDPALIPFIRPNKDREALKAREIVTVEELKQRLEHHSIYLIYLEDQLVGEMDYQIDPKHLYKKVADTAWIGITIGKNKPEAKESVSRQWNTWKERFSSVDLNGLS